MPDLPGVVPDSPAAPGGADGAAPGEVPSVPEGELGAVPGLSDGGGGVVAGVVAEPVLPDVLPA